MEDSKNSYNNLSKQNYEELENKIKVLNNIRVLNKLILDNLVNPVLLYDFSNDSILISNLAALSFYNISSTNLSQSKFDQIDPFLVKELRNINLDMLDKKINFIYEKIIFSKSIQKMYEVAITPIILTNRRYYLLEIMNIDKWSFTYETVKSDFQKETNNYKIMLESEIEKRKQAEQKLNSVNTKISLITNLKDSFFYTLRVISNNRFQLIEAGKAFKKTTGFELRDVEDLGGWISIISQGDLPVYHKLRLKLTPNEITTGEYRIVDKNGEFIWIKDYMLPQFEETGRFIQYIYGYAENITKLKKIEEDFEKIKEDEAKKGTIDLNNLKVNLSNKIELKAALDYYQKVVYDLFPYQVFHDNGIIVDASAQFQDLTGILINPLGKKTLFEIFDPAERQEYLKDIQGNNTKLFKVKIKAKNINKSIEFEAINIMCEYRDRMIKLLAMRDPIY